jgi:hypothetical protein
MSDFEVRVIHGEQPLLVVNRPNQVKMRSYNVE